MKQFISEVTKLNNEIPFPNYQGERVYMRSIYKHKPLPTDLSRWQSTVDAMLFDIDTDGEIFLMIDQSNVQANHTQRRAGKHIDGYWIKDLKCHAGMWDTGQGRWNNCNFDKPEAIVLASDTTGCKAFTGDFTGQIGEGGDCENIDMKNLSPIIMQPNKAYIGNVTMVHESIPVVEDCNRTIVRLNIPNYYH